jgi:hypothetical protein
MARCIHLFELTQVECPEGCGGHNAKQMRRVPSAATPKPKRPKSRWPEQRIGDGLRAPDYRAGRAGT